MGIVLCVFKMLYWWFFHQYREIVKGIAKEPAGWAASVSIPDDLESGINGSLMKNGGFRDCTNLDMSRS